MEAGEMTEWAGGEAFSRSAVRAMLDVPVPMRDGTRLSADIYLPSAATPVPAVAIRTGYGSNSPELADRGRFFASRGYACAIQDFRGRFDSEGTYYPYIHEGEDGFDFHEWIGQQPWCNGTVGTVGASDLGFSQIVAAPHASKYLKCMIPQAVGGDQYSTLFYPGGAFQLSALLPWSLRTSGRVQQVDSVQRWDDLVWTLPLRDSDAACGMDVPHWKDYMDHPAKDAYWQSLDLDLTWERVAAPAYFMSGWYDLAAPYVLKMFADLTSRGATAESRRCKALMGPWIHQLSVSPVVGAADFGDASKLDLRALALEWFDYWLKGTDNGVLDGPALQLFIMGSNRWCGTSSWPLPETDWQNWYFHSQGHANTLAGDGGLSGEVPGDEPADSYAYDPLSPVPTVGGAAWCNPAIHPLGPADQRNVEMRADVLCYTSAVLEQDLTVAGPVRVVLYAATDCRDTDWTAKLIDVTPDGRAMILCDGILRARYRAGFDREELLEPGEVYKYEIEIGATGNTFLTGHRIRVEISSSNFPHFDRNLNTGRPIATETQPVVAHQTVLHSADFPSHVVLPCQAPGWVDSAVLP
jgi:putative CocE/NonD family hydrolase